MVRLIIDSSSIPNFTANTSQVTLNLPTNIFCRHMCLTSAIFPLSYYNVPSGYNTIQINGTTYSIPPMNYSIIQLISELNSFVSTVVFSYSTQSLLIKITGGTSFNALNLGTLLGFASNTAYSYSGTLTAPYCYDMTAGVRAIRIVTNLSANSIILNSTSLGGLFTIPITNNYGFVQTYTNTTDEQNCNPINQLVQTITVNITSNAGKPLNFNGLNWYLEFLFKEVQNESDQYLRREDLGIIRYIPHNFYQDFSLLYGQPNIDGAEAIADYDQQQLDDAEPQPMESVDADE